MNHPISMAKFWKWMMEIYSTKWTGGYGDAPTKAWIEGLQNFSPAQIKLGVDKCVSKGLAWPPSLPEFVALCHYDAEDIGAPSLDEAYKEACNHGKDILQDCQGGYKRTIGKAWTHAAVYQAYKLVDGWQFMDSKKQRELFVSKYEQIIQRLSDGEQFYKPEPVMLIENNPSGVKLRGNTTVGIDTLRAIKQRLSE